MTEFTCNMCMTNMNPECRIICERCFEDALAALYDITPLEGGGRIIKEKGVI